MASTATTSTNTATPTADEHFLRITGHGKIKTFVKAALDLLRDSPEDTDTISKTRVVTLHTLPANVNLRNIDHSSNDQTIAVTPTQVDNMLKTTPRLITVAEIIKREYIKILEADKSPRLKGLCQYSHLRKLEDLTGVAILPDSEDDQQHADSTTKASSAELLDNQRSKYIIDALSGGNYPRQSQSPFMTITMSTSEIPDLVPAGATFQPPTIRKLSKNAKTRAKRREKKMLAK